MECVRQDEGGRRQIVGRDAPAQDIGDGGKLWDAMREQDHVAGGKKAVCTFLHTKGDNITASFRQ